VSNKKEERTNIFMVVDMHMHLADSRIYPDYWIYNVKKSMKQDLEKEIAIEETDKIIQTYINNTLNDFSGRKMIALMDECGIDKAVVLHADFGYGREDLEKIYEIIEIHHTMLKKYPERLIMFAGIDPRREKKGISLFKKCIEEYNFSGLKLYPPCGYEIDDKRLYAFYEICNHYRLPVLIHVGPSWEGMKSTFNYPNSILKVADEFTDIPFILGHAALLYYEESYRLPLLKNNIYLETSGYQKILDQETLLKDRMKNLMEYCPDKIVFGSDWPMYRSVKQDISFFESFDFMTDYYKENFFYKNALDILSMKRV